jgi:hypothetical protein
MPFAKGTGTAAVHGEFRTVSRALHIRLLILEERQYEDSPPRVSARTLPYQLFMSFSEFRCLPSEGVQYQSP